MICAGNPAAARKQQRPPGKTPDGRMMMAAPARLERTAYRLGGGRSIHLSYGALKSVQSTER